MTSRWVGPILGMAGAPAGLAAVPENKPISVGTATAVAGSRVYGAIRGPRASTPAGTSIAP